MGMDYARIATVTNITSEPFTHNFHGQPYTILAGETLQFPYDLARHMAKHLARKILFSDAKPEQLRNDRAVFTKETEMELMEKIIGPEFRKEVPKQLSEQELLRQRVAELNSTKPDGAAPAGRTKADVIAEMEKLGLPVDRRMSMAKLEEALSAAKNPS